jgi:CDP-glucose 4,6-dehydratase
MNTLRQFFKGKTVLVTGHTGFKGGWLSLWLIDMGAKVIGYSLKAQYANNISELGNLKTKMISIEANILDLKKLDIVFKTYNPDIVLHLAAQPIVRLSYDEPRETFETNIMGTINILECVRKYSTKSVVIITSDKCYKNMEREEGYVETDMFSDGDPYSCSKGCIEMIVQSYRNSFKLNIATARAGNVIGGGDWSADRLIPDIIKSIEAGKNIILRNPESIRPWQFVLEPLYGYLLLARDQYSGINRSSGWNFGPNTGNYVTVKTVTQLMIDYKFEDIKIVIEKDDTKHETKILKLNYDKSKNLLGWNNTLNIYETIKLIMEWYKNYDKRDVYQLCINQIKFFEQRIE